MNLTLSELEEEVRILSERLLKYVNLLDEVDARVHRLEDARDRAAAVMDGLPVQVRDSEYDRMDALDSVIDSEVRRNEV